MNGGCKRLKFRKAVVFDFAVIPITVVEHIYVVYPAMRGGELLFCTGKGFLTFFAAVSAVKYGNARFRRIKAVVAARRRLQVFMEGGDAAEAQELFDCSCVL